MAKRDDRLLRPNELSIELVPNRLSVLEGQRPGRLAEGLQTVVAPTPGEQTAGARAQPADRARARPGPRINLSTVVTAAFFLLIILGRVVGELGSSSPTPRPTSPGQAGAEPSSYAPSGGVIFGRASNGRCGVTEPATDFAAGDDVWWTATLPVALEPGQKVRWRVLLMAAVEVERVGPGDTPTGTWDTLCGSEPLAFDDLGSYVLEVWGSDDERLLAMGRFTLRVTKP